MILSYQLQSVLQLSVLSRVHFSDLPPLAMQTSTSPSDLSFLPVCVSASDVIAGKPEPEKRRIRSEPLDKRPTCLELQRPWSKQTMLDHAEALAEASHAAHDATHAARAVVSKAGGDTRNLHSLPNLCESPGETTARRLPSRSLSASQSMNSAPSPASVHSTTFEFLLSGGGAPQQQQQQQQQKQCSSLADAAARSSQTVMAARASMATKAHSTPLIA